MRSKLAHHWPLLPILAVALLLRVYRLDACALWTDELFSLQSSSGRGFWVERLPRGVVMDPAPRPTSLDNAAGISGIYRGQGTDTNPPLYYVLLRVWRDIFGDSVAALRSLSLLATLAAVIAIYLAGAAMGSRNVAALAGALCVVSATQIIYSHEVRGYALASAFTAIAAAALLRIQKDGFARARGFALGFVSLLAICTLYLAALPIVAIAIHAATQLRGPTRRKTLATGAIAALLTVAAIGPLLLQQRHYLGLRNQWMNAEQPRPLVDVAGEAARDIVAQIGPMRERSAGFAQLVGLLLLIAAVPLYIYVPGARLWLVWIGLSMGALATMDLLGQKTHLQWLRYTMLAGPGVIGLVASLATIKTKGLWLVPLAVVMFGAVSLPATYEAERGTKEDWTTLTKFVAQANVKPDDLWIVAAYGNRRWDHILYLGTCRYVPTPSLAAAILDNPKADLAPLQTEIERRRRFVLFAEPGTSVAGLPPPGWRATASTLFPTVGTITLYER